MKKLIIAMALLLPLSSGAKTTPAEKLVKRMEKIQKDGYMFGHQDDTFYGIFWQWDHGRSDVQELTGDYPAIMGFDLGGLEMGDAKNLDSVPFTRIREAAIKHHERGGIITFSWHPRNPVTGGTSWDVSSDQVVRSVLPGGEKHQLFQAWMKSVSDYLKTIVDSKGRRIPFILRPWHENNGSWFWWGRKLCTDEEYRGLWNMFQDYIMAQGFDNIVWSYSPNLDGNFDEATYMLRYPGNDRVAIIGEDAYQWGTEADYDKQLTDDLDFVSAFAKKNGKLFALTECGYKNIPDSTWWTRVFKPIVDKYDLLYVLPWRNYYKEYFAPAKGQQSADDFLRFHDAPNTLFLKDIK